MDIVVCVKTNPDLQMVRIKNREAVTEAVPYKLGDLEKNALEAAVVLRDAVGGKVTALCLAESNRKAAEGIKEALAMGADAAVVIDDPALAEPDQAAVAAALAAAVKKIGACDLLLFGEGSTDNYTGQVGARVAELLGLPQIGYARKIEAADGAVRCERSMDDMIETLEAPLPAVVSVVSEINDPAPTAATQATRIVTCRDIRPTPVRRPRCAGASGSQPTQRSARASQPTYRDRQCQAPRPGTRRPPGRR